MRKRTENGLRLKTNATPDERVGSRSFGEEVQHKFFDSAQVSPIILNLQDAAGSWRCNVRCPLGLPGFTTPTLARNEHCGAAGPQPRAHVQREDLYSA